ncbi:hypothetical protein GKE82_14355 [Conexibacter sp. W3-3-2]|uniref:HupE/UreJ family protein n=1 Tax=Conexibacter sp. W3-3-2 TaxID=2675227 RepID=UPI0012BA34CE|nr:HupE/UreJ family protein [Conexibacter sp. W3-3-2]MTD45437.1 hypothetical protein [Conexibacter sp. W3-3-2]
MTMPDRGRLRGSAGAVLLLLALPASAWAHGISGDATDKSTLEYVPLGIEHMLLGWDHLLFVLGILLLARGPQRAAKLISLFVLGHSVTLIVATLAEWRVSPTAVDVVIALSVVFVAVLGLRREPLDPRALWPPLTILGFGLVHGLGLSTRLQDLGIPDDGLLAKTIAFNVGIEIGQLIAVLVMFGVVRLLAQEVPRWPAVRRGLFATMAAVGLVLAVVLTVRGDDEEAGPVRLAGTTAQAGCTTVEEIATGGAAGGHPEQKFFGATETVPEDDLAHVRGDGWVIVRYGPRTTATQLAALRRWIEGSDRAVAAAPDPAQQAALVATTARRKATCVEHDLPAIQRFSAAWLADLRAGRIR